MLIGGKYELAGVIAENAGWRTFQAREIIGGRAVLVHQVLERPALADLEQRHGKVFDTCSSEGAEYVVTEAQPAERGEERFTRVGAWKVPQSRPAPAPPAGTGGASASGIFSAPLPQQEVPEPLPPAPPPPPAPAEPGDFTRLFQAPASQPAPAYSPAPAPPPASQEPGEFTRMFRAPQPAQSPPPPAPAVPPAAVASGEFTRFFQSPLGSATPEAARVLHAHGCTSRRAPAATSSAGGIHAPVSVARAGSGASRRQRGNRCVPDTARSRVHAPPHSGSGAERLHAHDAGAAPNGQRTQVPELPSAVAPQSAPVKPRFPVWLIVLFSFMGAVAIGMILYFALKH